MSEPISDFRPRCCWLQFSLRTALLLILIVAVGLSWWISYSQHREIRQLRAEIKRLKVEVGEIVIDEGQENKLHVVSVPAVEPLTWKWRVYIPRGRTAYVKRVIGRIPVSGRDWLQYQSVPPIISDNLHAGETVITVALRRGEDRQWRLLLHPTTPSQQPIEVPKTIVDILEANDFLQAWGSDVKGITAVDHEDTVELLRYLMNPFNNPQNQGLADGILVWIEDHPDK